VAGEVEALRATQAKAIAQQMALDEESLERLKAEKADAKVHTLSKTLDNHENPRKPLSPRGDVLEAKAKQSMQHWGYLVRMHEGCRGGRCAWLRGVAGRMRARAG
jgi:hypothetical protein